MLNIFRRRHCLISIDLALAASKPFRCCFGVKLRSPPAMRHYQTPQRSVLILFGAALVQFVKSRRPLATKKPQSATSIAKRVFPTKGECDRASQGSLLGVALLGRAGRPDMRGDTRDVRTSSLGPGQMMRAPKARRLDYAAIATYYQAWGFSPLEQINKSNFKGLQVVCARVMEPGINE